MARSWGFFFFFKTVAPRVVNVAAEHVEAVPKDVGGADAVESEMSGETVWEATQGSQGPVTPLRMPNT